MQVNWSIRNLGYGPALIDALEVYDGDALVATYNDLNEGRKTQLVRLIEGSLNADWIAVTNAMILAQRFDVNRRLLAHGDVLEIIQVKLNDRRIAKRIQRTLLDRVRITVHFRTMLGEQFSTETQLVDIQRRIAPQSVTRSQP